MADEIEIRVSSVRCVACKKRLTLESIADDLGTYQFDNALWICFHGGYGMFVDNLDEYSGGENTQPLPCHPDYQAVICHDCAHDLCEKVPWINDLIRPENSHAHSGYRDWTGHKGWDLPHKK